MKTFKITTRLFLITFLMLMSHHRISAAEVLFTEDFSQGLQKWQPVRDDGGMWKVINGKAEAYVDRRFTITEVVLKDEYWHNDWKDLEYRLEFTPLEGADKNISFKFNNLQNWYELHFVNGTCYLVRVKDGTMPFNYLTSITPLINGQTYIIRIQTVGNRIVIFLNDQAIIDTTDYTYNNNGGRIGLKAGTGAAYPTRVQFDNLVVTTVDPEDGKRLNVVLQKQTDTTWKNAEYDHANKWSANANSIGRWGCALASASMILNYHGISRLADGSAITPLTLNNWLKSQSDGFIDGVKSGYINWVVITRLTKELNQKYQTTKLETARHVGSELFKVVTDEIDGNKPSVLEISGHFLVGKGYTANKADLYINDPAYIFDVFSKHKTPLVSVRTFQPSHTDLSYLLLSHDPDLKMRLTNLDGSAISTLQEYETNIKDASPDSSLFMPTKMISELAKPSSGRLLLQVSRETFGPFNFQFFAYDTQANLSDLSQSGWVGKEPIKFMITYNREANSSLKQQLSLKQWRQQLKYLWEIKQIKKSYAYDAIDRIARLGETQPIVRQARYINNLRQQLNQYTSSMTVDGKKFLEQQLNALP